MFKSGQAKSVNLKLDGQIRRKGLRGLILSARKIQKNQCRAQRRKNGLAPSHPSQIWAEICQFWPKRTPFSALLGIKRVQKTAKRSSKSMKKVDKNIQVKDEFRIHNQSVSGIAWHVVVDRGPKGTAPPTGRTASAPPPKALGP